MNVHKFKKKGLSPIVATVLVILLTVTAGAILWTYVVPVINSSSETSCIEASSNYNIDYFCGDIDSAPISPFYLVFNVRSGPEDVDIEDLQLIVDYGGNQETYNIKDILGNNAPLPDPNGVERYRIRLGTSTMHVNQMATLLNSVSRVAVAPIINSNGQREVCEASGYFSPGDRFCAHAWEEAGSYLNF